MTNLQKLINGIIDAAEQYEGELVNIELYSFCEIETGAAELDRIATERGAPVDRCTYTYTDKDPPSAIDCLTARFKGGAMISSHYDRRTATPLEIQAEKLKEITTKGATP